ncbi:MAG: zinc metallopeptidase [Pseudomonadales bacterium]
MLYVILGFVVLLAVFGPTLWVRFAMARHSEPLEDMPGTGGELAKHLIERFELGDIKVEEAPAGNDHFDPQARAVRLSPNNFNGKSITAVAVAAHEVGHAIQFARGEPVFKLRARYIPKAMKLKRAGVVLLSLVPFVAIVFKAPALFIGLIAIGIGFQLIGALAYLIVLPEEWDASFNKALPILVDDYVPARFEGSIRQVLRAAALTYFAGALADLLNLGRWIMILRR